MFYCDPCAQENGYPETIMRSYGQCEICDESRVCNSRASGLLPPSRLRKLNLTPVPVEIVQDNDQIDYSRLDKFMALFTQDEIDAWGKGERPTWLLDAMLWFMNQDPGHRELMRRLADS